MKLSFTLTLICTCLSLTMAQDSDQDAYTQEQNQIVNPDGSYSFVWATSNGIRHQEVGEGGIYAEGAFNYVGSDGVPVDIQYTADENGYRATGSHIPTPPPIPAYILKALAYLRENPPASP